MKSMTKLGLVLGGTLLVLLVVFFLGGFSSTGNAIIEGKSLNNFISCLNEKGVLLYGFANSLQVKAQLDLFGNSSKKLNIIDCNNQPEKCQGVIIYPSWKIDNRIISSGLSIGILSDLSGCKL